MSNEASVFELAEGTRVQIDGLPYFVKGCAVVTGFVKPNTEACAERVGRLSATNDQVNPVAASNQPQPNSVAPQLGLNALLGDSAIGAWGYGGKKTMPLEIDQTDWSKQPIDVRWQQTGPKEGCRC